MSGALTVGESLLGIGAAAALAGVFDLATGGGYKTISVNTPPAIYSIAIRGAAAPYIPYFIYLFPLSPQNLRKEQAGMGNFYDVAGSPFQFGVQRVPDVYGLNLPVFIIEGTTGVKRHSGDGYLFTGLESIQVLQAAIAQYFGLVASASQQVGGSVSLPRLEFYDFYTSDFYQVIPLGSQGIYQNAARPQLLNYHYRLVAVENLLAPIAQGVDDLLGSLSGGVSDGTAGMGTTLGSALGNYSPASVGG